MRLRSSMAGAAGLLLALCIGVVWAGFAGNSRVAVPGDVGFGNDVVELPSGMAAQRDARQTVGKLTQSALASVNVGNVSVIELAGDYSRGNPVPRFDVAQSYFATHPDEYDFLVVFTTFEFATGDATAFYNAIRNDTQGIGQEQFDHSALFGSDGRLQGYIDMAAVGRYVFQSNSPDYVSPLGTLAHELMHRWGVHLAYRDGAGTSTDLIGLEDAHWSLLVDTDASVMYGANWEEVAPGQFRIVEARQRFSPWDLYIAGFADASEVPPTTLIRNASLDPSQLPVVGVETGGVAETVSISQVIDVEGPRIPGSQQSQRHFNAGIILLARPGEQVDPSLLVQLERFRVDFESYFQSITGGRASLSLASSSEEPAAEIGPPQPLSGSPNPAPGSPLAAAIAWLKQSQHQDGRWEDRAGSAVRDTAMAYAALAQTDPGYAGLAAARAYLDAQSLENTDSAAWRVLFGNTGLPSDAALLTPSHGDGIGIRPDWQPSAIDSSLALRSTVDEGLLDPAAIARLGDFLVAAQAADGSFAYTTSGPGSVRASAIAARGLLRSSSSSQLAAGDAARSWLLANADFSEQTATAGEAAELLFNAGVLMLPEQIQNDLVSALLARQGNAGDWSGSTYTTALAVLALALHEQPNLRLANASANPVAPVAGEPVTLRVRILNNGGQPSGPTTLAWFRDGIPSDGGTAIDSVLPISPLLPGGSFDASVTIEASTILGVGALFAVVDADNSVVESNEQDNQAALQVPVSPYRDGADAALFAMDVSVSPPSYAAVGEQITVSGTVRNLGVDALVQIPLTLYRRIGGESFILAETLVDLPSASSAAFELSFQIEQLGNYDLHLVADPGNAFAEVDESNNAVDLSLAYVDSIDLSITPESIVVSPDQPIIGDDVHITATISNNGTRQSAATSVTLQRDTDGAWQTLASLPLTLDAGGTVTREFIWRPDSVGSHQLRVIVDPDDLVAELDEGNNQAHLELSVMPNDQADLVVVPGSIVASPEPAIEGGSLSVVARIENLGTVQTDGFDVGLYLGDPRSGGMRLATQHVESGLGASGQMLLQFDVDAFPAAGDVDLFVYVDPDFAITESNEEDNLGVLSISVLALPDLSVSDASVAMEPASPIAGEPIRIMVTVSNIGQQISDVVPVRLYQRAGQEQVEVLPLQSLPPVAPGEYQTLAWEWTLDVQFGADSLAVAIDPDNILQEGSEANNTVVTALNLQDGAMFVSEAYFSPNGDGVRDVTQVTFALSGAAIHSVAVRDVSGNDVVSLAAVRSADGNSVVAQWDGLDRSRQIAPDGTYRLVAIGVDDQEISQVEVVLDTDRPMALEAANGDRAVIKVLPQSRNPWRRPLEFSDGDGFAYTWGSQQNASTAMRRGVLRSDLLMGDVESVVSAGWLDRYASDHSLLRISVQDILVQSIDGQLLMLLKESAGTGNDSYSLWKQSPVETDVPVRMAGGLSSSDAMAILGELEGSRLLVGDSDAYGARWIVDLHTGSSTPLRDPNYGTEVLKVYPQGVVLGIANDDSDGGYQDVAFVPAASASPVVSIDGMYLTYCGFLRVQFDPSSPRALVHSQESGYETIDLIDLRTDQHQLLAETTSYDYVCDDGGNEFAAGSTGRTSNAGPGFSKAGIVQPRMTTLRAFWLERQHQIGLIVHGSVLQEGDGEEDPDLDATPRFDRFSAYGTRIASTELPSNGRIGAYDEWLGQHPGAVLRGEPAGISPQCLPSLVDDWQGLADRHAFEQTGYDPATGTAYVVDGDVAAVGPADEPLTDYCEGATNFLAVTSSAATRLGGLTSWPLVDATDRLSYPQTRFQGSDANFPTGWPKFIHRNGTQLRRDGRVVVAGSVGSRPWSLTPSLIDAWPSESRLDLRDDAESNADVSVFSTLDRMSVVLRAQSDGRAVRLYGLATDRNFDRFSIDYAPAGDPENWRSVVPATRNEVQFDNFITWAAPQEGAYVFRLTVVDRAGNSRRRFASAEVQFASPIVDLRQSQRAISPNGDGVQDVLTLSFSVSRPTDQRFRVLDDAGRTVFEDYRVFGAQELGAQTWEWNGRNASGQLQAEGHYRVELSSGYVIGVLLDVSLPQIVSATLSPAYPPQDYAVSHCVDDYFGSHRSVELDIQLQRRTLESVAWTTWRALPRCGVNHEIFATRLSRSDLLKYEYRLVATDVAGNTTATQFPQPGSVFALLSVGAFTDMPPFRLVFWQAPPFSPYRKSDIPAHLIKPVGSGAMTVLAPDPEASLFFTSDEGFPAGDVQVDIAPLVGPSTDPLDWSTHIVASTRVTPLQPNVASLPVDLSEFNLQQIAVRVRSQRPDGTVASSNAFRFQVGGVTVDCVQSADRQLSIHALLPEPLTSPAAVLTRTGFGLPQISSSVEAGNAVGTTRLIRYQLPESAEIPGSVRFSVVDGRGYAYQEEIAYTGCSTAGDTSGAVSIAPVVGEQCDAAPTHEVRAVVSIEGDYEAFSLTLRDPRQIDPVVIASGDSGEVDPDGYVIATAGIPGSEAELTLDLRLSTGEHRIEVSSFPLDRTAPLISLVPAVGNAPGCPDATGGFLTQADIFSDTRLEYRAEVGSSDGSSAVFSPVDCSYAGQLDVHHNRLKCTDNPGVGPVAPNDQAQTASVRLDRTDPSIESVQSMRFRAFDWSGAQVCASTSISVDFSAQLSERSLPEPRFQTVNNPQHVAISTDGDNANHVARWFFAANEPLSVTGDLYRAQRSASSLTRSGPSLLRFFDEVVPQGSFDPQWDASNSGLADGDYVAVFTGQDDCGNTRVLERFLVVDSTVPSLDLLQPLDGDVFQGPSVEVIGSVLDPLLEHYELLVGTSVQGPWVQLTDGTASVPTSRVLAQWPTLGQVGQRWIRLQAEDVLGNRAEQTHAISLLDRPVVVDGARTVPSLFSPNGDGVLDATQVEVQLRRQASVRMVLLSTTGDELAVLADIVGQQPGYVRVPWDGMVNGVAASDGRYNVLIEAIDSAIPSNRDSVELTIDVDTTAPDLHDVFPVDQGFASCADAVGFSVVEAHLHQFSALLVDSAGSQTAQSHGQQSGSVAVADLAGMAEGQYRLELSASDEAGNRSTAQSTFTLDCTAPTSAIESPVNGAVLPNVANRTTAIVGSATDTNFAHYRLERISDAPPGVALIAEGDQPLQNEQIAEWQPQDADGDYSLRLTAEDRAGNVGESTIAISLDGTPPEAVIIYPYDGSEISGYSRIFGTATDLHFADFRLELATPQDAAANHWSTVFQSDLPVENGTLGNVVLSLNGEMRVRLQVTDLAGLQSQVEMGVLIDNQPPPAPVNLTAIAEGQGNVRLTWQGGDAPDLEGFRIYLKGRWYDANLVTGHSFLVRDLSEGEWPFAVEAVDHAGNSSAQSNTATARIDLTPPEVQLVRPLANERAHGIVEVLGSAFSSDDFDAWELRLIDIASASETVLRRGELPVQNATLHTLDTRGYPENAALRLLLSASDESGNSAQDSVDFLVDNVAPSAPTGLTAALSGADVQVAWNPNTESDLLGYLLYRNGSLLNATGTLPADLRPYALPENQRTDAGPPDGELVYRAYAVDLAGNVSPPSIAANVDRNLDPPHVTITRPQEGLVFDDAIEIAAETGQRDIAQVQFLFRAAGDASWTAIGGPAMEAPWRATFDPDGLTYGQFQLSAMATDNTGAVDPNPPIVNVEYADTTPPAAPAVITARANADAVQVTWQAGSEADLAAYRVERRQADGSWIQVALVAHPTSQATESGRPLGEHVYRVLAVDASDNASEPSSNGIAYVFEPAIDPQPYSPTDATDFVLVGTGAERAGQATVAVDSDLAHVEHDVGALDAVMAFALDPLPLEDGPNQIAMWILDGDGNRSIAATTRVTRGSIPIAPTGLVGVAGSGSAQLQWDAVTGVDIAGYRLFVDGVPVLADQAIDQSINAQSTVGNATLAIDGDPASAWTDSAAALDDALQGSLELEWNYEELLSGLRLHWLSDDRSARAFDVEGWFDGHWNLLRQVTENSGADLLIRFDNAYPTRRIRLLLHRAQRYGGEQALASILPLRRALVIGTTANVDVVEGRHDYAVSAVSQLGFESPASLPWTSEVGDATAPQAVELSGELDGSDAVLTWTASSSIDVADYLLYRDDQLLADTGSSAVHQHRDVRPANGAHHYVVHAVDAVGNISEASNEVVLILTGDPPGTPRIIRVTSQPDQPALLVEWQAGSGTLPTSYRLLYSHERDGQTDPYRELVRVSTTSYLHTGLTTGERVFYRVQSVDDGGNLSEPSDPVGGEVRDLSAPAAPRLMSPTSPGMPIAWHRSLIDVCGTADPGSLVGISVNGVATGALIRASNSDAVAVHPSVDGQRDEILSPDGRWLLRSASYHLEGQSLIGGVELPVNYDFGNADEIRFARNGDTLFGRSYNRAVYSRSGYRDAHDIPESRGIRAFDIDPSQRQLAYHLYDQNQWQLWIQDLESGDIAKFAMAGGVDVVRWSGRSSLYVQRGATGIDRFDVAAGTSDVVVSGMTLSGSIDTSPVDDAVLYVEVAAGGDIVWVDAADSGPRQLVQRNEAVFASAWSPDGDQIAILMTDRVQLLDSRTGALLRTITLIDPVSNDPQELHWSPSGRLLVSERYASGRPAQVISLSGRFCVYGIPVQQGWNVVDAVAESANGVRSERSQPINLDVNYDLPDLSLSASDIAFVPASGQPGQRFTASVTIRNRGSVDASRVTYSAVLMDPAGNRAELQPSTTDDPDIDANGFSQIEVPLGLLEQGGDYRLEIQVDPFNQIEESDEQNNQSVAVLHVFGDGEARLTLAVDDTQAAPGDGFAGALRVDGAAGFTGTATLRIVDENGELIDSILSRPVGPLAFAQSWQEDWGWQPSAVILSGRYTARAELRDSSGQLLQEVARDLFIAASNDIRLVLQPASVEAAVGTPVAMQFGLDYAAGNQLIAGGELELTAVDAMGNASLIWQGGTGVLLPGYVVRKTASWNTAGSATGPVRLRLAFTAPGIDQRIEREVVLTSDPSTAHLVGSLGITPAASLVLGALDSQLRYRVINDGAVDLSELDIKVSVRVDGSNDVLLGDAQSTTLAAGEALEGQLSLSSLPQLPQSYLATLETRTSNGSWQLLSQLGLSSVDALAPEIALLSPTLDGLYPPSAPLLANITDQHSRVASAQFSLDGGAWSGLAAQGSRYQTLLSGLADGTHALRIRATDSWGNLATDEAVQFRVDGTSPVITISGVADGDLGNTPVLPIVSAQDANPVELSSWIDGVAFVPGSAIATEGTHQLTAIAVDAAGNRSDRDLTFTIDTTAPDITIVSPADGTSVSDADVLVRVQTEPDALVTLNAEQWQSQQQADSAGVAEFAAVPLLSGANTLSVTALDAASNLSDPVSVSVNRVSPASEITGSVQPALAQLARGADLQLNVTLDNATSTAFAALPVEVRVRGSNGLLLDTWSDQPAVPASGAVSRPVSLATDGWPLGAIAIELLIDVEGSWQTLDSSSVNLLDATAPSINALLPSAGSLTTPPVSLAASASDDDHVAAVSYRIDGGAWVPLMTAVPGEPWQGEAAPVDGDHIVEFRAQDDAGNLALSPAVAFSVDGTAPQITIAGVEDGGVYGAPVTPQIAVLDAHPGSLVLTLNGSPFGNGTSIQSSGSYVLEAIAEDAVGLSSPRQISFELDLEPSFVTIDSPTDEVIVTEPMVAVTGTTRPDAAVQVAGMTTIASTTADSAGHYVIDSMALVEGDNTLVATATDRFGHVSPEAVVTIRYSTVGSSGITASLHAVPQPLPAGQSITLDYALEEHAGLARSAMPMRLAVRHLATSTSEYESIQPIDVAANEQLTGTLLVESTGWMLGASVAELSVQVDGSWHVSATAGVAVVDRDPPLLSFVAPDDGSYHAQQVSVVVDASDALGQVAAAELRIQDGEWMAMSREPGTAGRWIATAAAGIDGIAQLQVQASDDAGNVSPTMSRSIHIDSTAPLIDITGVVDGQLGNSAVVPVIVVSDASPLVTTMQLDGTDFVSATAVSAPGVHQLDIHAVDAAGNAADRHLTFEIDTTAPLLQITSPQPGSTVRAPQIDVIGHTDALAAVELDVAGFTAHAVADSRGDFVMSNIALVLGSNDIRARATDAAGNTSDWTEVQVQRVGIGTLFGTIAAPSSLHQGETLVVNILLRNDQDTALLIQPAQVIARLHDGSLIELDTRDLSLNPGAQSAYVLAVDTHGWPEGLVELRLVATTDSAVQLASVALDLLPAGASTPQPPPPVPQPHLIPAIDARWIALLAMMIAGMAFLRQRRHGAAR